jgi:1-acyl-sn-glycerol-3-phosphate acyltransferase
MVFVTSYEVRDQWATGFFSKLGGCIFVERRNYSTLLADIQQIKQALRSGHTVCLFPEGTTSSGSMLPWKSSLLEAAARLGVPVVPLAIKYITVNGRAVFGQDKDLLYYYGDMDFTSHLGRLVREVGSVSVRVDILEPTVGKARKKITESARLSVKRQLYL